MVCMTKGDALKYTNTKTSTDAVASKNTLKLLKTCGGASELAKNYEITLRERSISLSSNFIL